MVFCKHKKGFCTQKWQKMASNKKGKKINIKVCHTSFHTLKTDGKQLQLHTNTFLSNSSMPILTWAKKWKQQSKRKRDQSDKGTEKGKKKKKKDRPDKQILRTINHDLSDLKTLFICISISVRKYDNVWVCGKHLNVLHILTQTTIYSQKRRFPLCTETLLHGP